MTVPTNRTRRRRLPNRSDVPAWAARLLAGEAPEYGTEDHHPFVGWLYFGDAVPGLPDSTSREGHEILAVARNGSSAHA